MGHACATIDDDTIWVLGGLDKYHTCVNDVWSLTISKEGPVTVKASKTSAPWPARCMSSAFKYQKKIWVFGGVSSPNGNPLGDLWNSSVSPVSWKKTEAPPGLNAAIATGAATSGSKPRTVFRMRERYGEKGWKTSDCHFDLTNVTETSLNWSKSATPSQLNINDEWNAWTSEPHSIAVAGFKDRLYLRFLHRNALYGETVAAPIFVCVNK
jgi:hypothetical protein